VQKIVNFAIVDNVPVYTMFGIGKIYDGEAYHCQLWGPRHEERNRIHAVPLVYFGLILFFTTNYFAFFLNNSVLKYFSPLSGIITTILPFFNDLLSVLAAKRAAPELIPNKRPSV
jgi:hypothetical protein